jgi:hypothetical protein
VTNWQKCSVDSPTGADGGDVGCGLRWWLANEEQTPDSGPDGSKDPGRRGGAGCGRVILAMWVAHR